jgi:hypothetical protein
VTITVDGQAAPRELTKAESEELDRAVWPRREATTALPRVPFLYGYRPLVRTGFLLAVEPGQARTIEARGSVGLGPVFGGSIQPAPPTLARHPLLGRTLSKGRYYLDYLVSPIRSWAEAGPIQITVRYPARWGFSGGFAASPEVKEDPGFKSAAPAGWARAEQGELAVATLRASAESGSRLVLELEADEPLPHRGGPLLGFGGMFGDGGGFQMRFGYEIAAPSWLFYSINLDTDFRSRFVAAPVVEAVTPWFWLVPWVGAGLGMPVRVRPDTGVGIRFQASMGWGPLALVTSFDLFPGAASGSAERFRVTMLGQISF